MKISIIGTGYVGLTAGVGLASKGHDVTCVDIDEEKVQTINEGRSPIHEEGLEELLQDVLESGNLTATTNTENAVQETEITFLAVGTPSNDDGSIDTSYIEDAAEDVGHALADKDGYHIVGVRSTVVPRTTRDTIIPLLEDASGRTAGEDLGIGMTPEFLREGVALQDFLDPDRIVIGELDEASGDQIEAVYEDFDAPIVRTSLEAAELIKYASNSLLATKISFINEIGNICKELGIDVYDVADAVGMDHRIERQFLNAGCGFGGSCFPKDVRALHAMAKNELDVTPRILDSTIAVNTDQKRRIVDILDDRMDLDGARVAVLGLSFKPGTDDIRKAPAITVIGELKARGATVTGYDPEAMENMQEVHPDITYASSSQEALEDADACLILTDWDEFTGLDPADLPSPTLEGRKLDKAEGICW